MGSLIKPPRLDEAEIIERYLAGESKSMLVLRTGKSDPWIADLLRRHGIAIRDTSQARRASIPLRTPSPKGKSPS